MPSKSLPFMSVITVKGGCVIAVSMSNPNGVMVVRWVPSLVVSVDVLLFAIIFGPASVHFYGGETHAGGECTNSHPRLRAKGSDDSTSDIEFPSRSSMRVCVPADEPRQSISWSIELRAERSLPR
jgi:hypothetical protein